MTTSEIRTFLSHPSLSVHERSSHRGDSPEPDVFNLQVCGGRNGLRGAQREGRLFWSTFEGSPEVCVHIEAYLGLWLLIAPSLRSFAASHAFLLSDPPPSLRPTSTGTGTLVFTGRLLLSGVSPPHRSVGVRDETWSLALGLFRDICNPEPSAWSSPSLVVVLRLRLRRMLL
ncbi:hypothetical protein EYF80_028280 [Liparis tanakae]|uniref:Uncharacterized protein n=1 Tax=Liparis tanakae TaxID=230148 RepID=A0A4Z2H8F8_9TELE|nr:hypothetical protein EYF80_028280 [Liparis tanakae]